MLRSLFNIKYVDLASDSDQVISFFTNRITRKCCLKRYRVVICDYELEGSAQMSRTIKILTKLRIQQGRAGDSSKSDSSLNLQGSEINDNSVL